LAKVMLASQSRAL